jgi:hypothetical protein
VKLVRVGDDGTAHLREERIAIVKVSQTNAVPLGCLVWCDSSGLVFACGCTDLVLWPGRVIRAAPLQTLRWWERQPVKHALPQPYSSVVAARVDYCLPEIVAGCHASFTRSALTSFFDISGIPINLL